MNKIKKTKTSYTSIEQWIGNEQQPLFIYKKKESAQMILLMGIALAVSIIVIASIGTELNSLKAVISNERSQSLLPEFLNLKETYGTLLNYNLVITSIPALVIGESILPILYNGDITMNITRAIRETTESIYSLYLTHNMIVEVVYHGFWYSHLTTYGDHIYNVKVTLSLDDGTTYLSEDVVYSVICNLPTAS